MPELSRQMAEHGRTVTITPAMTDRRNETGSERSQLDEFVLGYRDCAKESLRYLEASTVTVSDADEAETDGRRLVDALRVHLIEHEEATIRRRRRRRSSYDDDDEEPGPSAASLGHVDGRQSSRQPPRRRRRPRATTLSTHLRRRVHHSQALHSLEDVQTVHLRSTEEDGHSTAVSRKVSARINTSGDSGHDGDVAVETSGVSVGNTAPDDVEVDRRNVDDLRHCARQLSHLADRDVSVRLLLNELFQLMDSDVNDS